MAKRKLSLPLIIILLLGLGLRLVNLGQSFWLDEASQAQMSSLTLSQIWSGRSGDFHPPLFYALAHFWLQFGRSEIWLRLPSVVFGVLNIYLLYIFAQKVFPDKKVKIGNWDLRLDICASFLLAVNPFQVYYSQEFRSYSLLCLLGTWSMYLLFTNKFFWLALVNALLLYTHYSSIFLIATQVIYIAVYQKGHFKQCLLSLVVSLSLLLPWIPQLTKQLHAGVNIDTYLPGWRQVLSVSTLKTVPLTFFKLVAGRINFISVPIYLIYIVFVLGVTFVSFRFAKHARNFLLTWAILPVLLMIIVSFAFPQNQPFRVIFVFPGLVLVFSQAVLRFPKLFFTLFVYIALVGNLAYFTRPRLQREQWRQALEFVTASVGSDSVVVVKFSDRFAPMSWYFPDFPVLAAVPTFPAKPDQVTRRLASVSINKPSQVFLFDYLGDLTDPYREVDLVLVNLGYQRSKTYDYPGVGFIHLFNRI